MGDLIQLRDTSKDIEHCVHKKQHESLPYECPGCNYVTESLRNNLIKNGDHYIIDFRWSVYNRSNCYKTFDGRNEGGKWDWYIGKARLNKYFQLVETFNGKLQYT